MLEASLVEREACCPATHDNPLASPEPCRLLRCPRQKTPRPGGTHVPAHRPLPAPQSHHKPLDTFLLSVWTRHTCSPLRESTTCPASKAVKSLRPHSQVSSPSPSLGWARSVQAPAADS